MKIKKFVKDLGKNIFNEEIRRNNPQVAVKEWQCVRIMLLVLKPR